MKDVLYVTHRVPWPPDRGDRIRTCNIVKFLGHRCRLHLVSLADEVPPVDTLRTLRSHCESVTIVPQGRDGWLRAAGMFACGRTVTEGLFCSPRLTAEVRKLACSVNFTAALASSSGVAQYLQLPELRETRVWVDLIDVDSQKWLDYAGASGPLMAQVYRREGQRLRRLESRLARTCDRLTVVSAAEVAVFRQFCSAGEVSAVTNGVDLDYFARPVAAEELPRCVFVGVLNYKPNVDGVLWFARNIWPQLSARHPDAAFHVVGRDPAPEILELAQVPGIRVIGPVADVRDELWSAAVVVTPLLIARGVQNKVLEAFAASRAVVSTRPPLTGLGVTDNEQAVLAETPAEWVDAIDSLLQDPRGRSRLGRAARDWVADHHRWDVCLSEFDQLLEGPGAQVAQVVTATGMENHS